MAHRVIYTVGHSNHELADFLALLRRHRITAVADVRSHPVSRLAHFRRGALEQNLAAVGAVYVFLGRELGARRSEAECYVDGQVDFNRAAELPLFRQGLDRLLRGAADYRIAIMCAERDPLDCHRTFLVARQLLARGVLLRHILADGTLEEHAQTEERLLKMARVERTLFDAAAPGDELLARAYQIRGSQIAYRQRD